MSLKPSTSTKSANGSPWETMSAGVDARQAQLRPMWEMTPAQRVAAMHRGELTEPQLLAWAARHPDQVPTTNGEFAFIAHSTPEACIDCPACGGEVLPSGTDQLARHPDERDPAFGTPNGFRGDLVAACPASERTLAQARELATTPKVTS